MSAKVLLISLYDSEALGIRYLSGHLKKHGHKASVLFFKELKFLGDDMLRDIGGNMACDSPTNQELDYLRQIIWQIRPDIIGISVRSAFFEEAKMLTRQIKKIKEFSRIPIIWGGIHVTSNPEECIKHADMICIGEGEAAFVDLANNIKRPGRIRNLENFWIKEGRKIYKNGVRNLYDLDDLASPDYEESDKYYIKCSPLINEHPVYCTMTSRGCFFSCSFCCNCYLKEIYRGKGRYIRRISVDNLMKELKHAKKRFTKLRLINFHDEIFTFDKKWIREFCRQYKKHIDVPFFCWIHPDFIQEDIIADLADAGLSYATIGIQSGSEELRKRYLERKGSNEQIIKAAKILHKYIIPTYDLILDMPFETDEDAMKTLELLLEIPRPFHIDAFSLVYLPGTRLTKKCIDEGYITEDMLDHKTKKSIKHWYALRQGARSAAKQKIYDLISLTPHFLISKPEIREIIADKKKLESFNPARFKKEKLHMAKYDIPREFRADQKNEFRLFLHNLKEDVKDIKLEIKINEFASWTLRIPVIRKDEAASVIFRYPEMDFMICTSESYIPLKYQPSDIKCNPLAKKGKKQLNIVLKDGSGKTIHDLKSTIRLTKGRSSFMPHIRKRFKQARLNRLKGFRSLFEDMFYVIKDLQSSGRQDHGLFDPSGGNSRNFTIYSGWYPLEEGSASSSRWTRKTASFYLKPDKSRLKLNLVINHPDISKKPVKLKVYASYGVGRFSFNRQIKIFRLDEKKEYLLDCMIPRLNRHKIRSFTLKLDRTWHPHDFGIEDKRYLGASVKGIWTE
ncbi:radical SAM protein [Candidatus Woesearchaeota archaeon]|nr:radical SAM protein [Candidatus Woesearchaeota archaeon]